MSGSEVKKLVTVVAQQQTQITSLIDTVVELVRRRTHENTPMYQTALDMQIAQQERQTHVVQIAEHSRQEPKEVAPERSVAQPVHKEPSVEQPFHKEPSVEQLVHAEPRAIELMPVPEHLEPFLAHEESSPVQNRNELILEYPSWSRYAVRKEPIVDPKVDDDSLTESELLHFDDLPESLNSAILLASGSEKGSARSKNQQSEDQLQKVILSADNSQQPGSHRCESYGLLTNNPDLKNPPLPDIVNNTNKGGKDIRLQRLLWANRKCNQCNSRQHWSHECEFLIDMVLNRGIYTLKKRMKDSDESSTSVIITSAR